MDNKKKGILPGSFMKINLLILVFMLTAPLAFAEELIIWSRAAWSSYMVEGFNKKMQSEGKDIVAVNNMIGFADFPIKFTAALSARERIDVVNIDLVNVPYYAAVGALQDMTDFLKGKTYYDKLNKAMLALGTLEGKHFAAPNAADVSAFAYNKKLLKQYGFDGPPKNYADMLTMCKAFAGTGKFFMAWPSVSTGEMIFTFQPMAWANGGSWVSKDGKKMEINHPRNRETYAHYLKMLEMGCVPKNVAAWDWPDKQDGFLAGDVAMIGTGNFMINAVKDHLDKVDPGYTPFFNKDGSRKSAFVGGDLIAIPATTGNMDAALEYINFVLSREGQVDVSTKSGSIPIREDLFDDNPYLTEDHLVFARASAVGGVPYTPVYQEMMNPWSATNQRIFAGEDLDKVLSEQNAAMQRIIDAGHN